eukprot:TRINITY_DN55208_c0_g1_i1.p1 TRINITY_DN55208_c0_g1~~TRINITY_DN55208_c0_g1_i1.p1  ORF type:complete len:384 (-),score=63.85 TRINITY_DN55208_c0_g1_i1:247-1398(-)
MGELYDDFNYPPAQRSHTMMLQTIQCAPRVSPKRERQCPTALKVDDIAGAQVGTTGPLLTMKYVRNKPNLFDNADIPGSSPTKLIPAEVRKYNRFNTTNADIELSSPNTTTFRTSRRIDPNNPSYALPSVEVRPVTPPPLRADPLRTDDIAGTSSRPLHRSPTRSIMDYSDIPGSTADSSVIAKKHKFGIKRPPEVPDVVQYFTTNRCVNPLAPEYFLGAPNGETCGAIEGNRPKSLPKERPPELALLSLRVDDIPGATSQSKIPKAHERRHFRNPNDISDIEAASPKAFHRLSDRCVDPNNPDYPPLAWRKRDAAVSPMFPPVASPSHTPIGSPPRSLHSTPRPRGSPPQLRTPASSRSKASSSADVFSASPVLPAVFSLPH